jgi:hypothetical protein
MDDKTYRRMFSPGSCSCGKIFRSMSAEAFHRHNFPALCRPPKRRKKDKCKDRKMSPNVTC